VRLPRRDFFHPTAGAAALTATPCVVRTQTVERLQVMKHTVLALVVAAGVLSAGGIAIGQQKQTPVEIELMTYPEIFAAIHDQGKTVSGRDWAPRPRPWSHR
jgi:hypothetical protein